MHKIGCMERDSAQVAGELTPRLALLAALRARGNLTAAAAEVGVPQPTASRWLAGLAETTGLALIARTGRGIELTKAGNALAEASAGALETVTAGMERAAEAADPERGHVTFAFLHTMGYSRVPELLRGFRCAYPRVRFTLMQDAHEVILQRVREGSADLGLTSPLPSTGTEFSSAGLFTDELMLVVGPEHRLAGGNAARLRWCREETFVATKPGYGLREIADRLCAEAGFTPHPAFEGEDVDTVRGLVAAGLGIAVLPAREHEPLPGTVERPLAPRQWRQIALVHSAHRPLPPAARRFREWAAAGPAT